MGFSVSTPAAYVRSDPPPRALVSHSSEAASRRAASRSTQVSEANGDVAEFHRAMQLAMNDLVGYSPSGAGGGSGAAQGGYAPRGSTSLQLLNSGVERLVLLSIAARIATMVQHMEETSKRAPPSLDVIRDIPRHVLTAKLVLALLSSQHTPDTSSCTICCRTYEEILKTASQEVNEKNEEDKEDEEGRGDGDKIERVSLTSSAEDSVPDVLLFPCHHVFCSTCAEQWLARSDLCPNCRHSVAEPIEKPMSVAGDATPMAGGNRGSRSSLAQVCASLSQLRVTAPEWWVTATGEDGDAADDNSVNLGEVSDGETQHRVESREASSHADTDSADAAMRLRSSGSFLSRARPPPVAGRGVRAPLHGEARWEGRRRSMLSRTLRECDVECESPHQRRVSAGPRCANAAEGDRQVSGALLPYESAAHEG